MNKLILTGALAALSSLCLQGVSIGHGGTYRGPGDTVPPGGGGGGGGGGPATPGPAGPSTPGPSGPGAPGPGAPGAPSTGGAARPSTGSTQQADLTLWQFWWGFNKEPYLNLKSKVWAAVSTGSDEFFSGKGGTGARDIYRPSETTVREKVVPALVKALETERNNHIITGAMVGLAKIGDAKNEDGKSSMSEKIKPFLINDNAEIQETAAVALGILGNDSPEILDLLSALLADDSSKVRDAHKTKIEGEIPVRVRAFSAYGLGLIGARSSDEGRKQMMVNALTKQLDKSARTSQRDIPVACLTAIGLVPLAWDSADDVLKPGKVTEVKTRNDQLRFLIDYYKDDSNEFLNRAHAPTAMARLLNDPNSPVPADSKLREQVAKTLIEDLGKDSKARAEMMWSCVLALGQIGDCDNDALDQEIRKTLVNVAVNSKDPQSKYFAIMASGQVGGRAGAGEGEALNGAKDVRTLLTDMLKSKSVGDRSWAGMAIGVMEYALADAKQPTSPEMSKAVASALAESKTPQEIGAFAIALGLMKDIDSKTIVREKFDKIADNDARGYCSVGLGLMNDVEYIKQIQEVIKKSKYQPDMLRSAAIGLGLLGDKSIVPDLVRMLGESTSTAPQAAIASALGFIGDTRSIDPLIAFIENKQNSDESRGFAAAALGIVSDKEALPWNSKISININYRANTPTLTSPDTGTGILDIL